jgi:hypothetical protein
MKRLKQIDDDCNLLEVVSGILGQSGVEFKEKQILCDDRLRAAFVTENPDGTKTIVDVIDQ